MKQKYFVVLVAIDALGRRTLKCPTIGEIAKFLNIPKTTARNRLLWLEKSGMVIAEKFDYKSTGAWCFEPTQEGKLWIMNQKVMF